MESNAKEYSPAVQGVTVCRYVRMGPTASLITGLTVKAMQQKIDSGVWLQGHEWKKGPDGNRYLDVLGYENWVEGRRGGE